MEELIQGLKGMDPTEIAFGAGVLGAALMLVAICRIVWFFVSAIGYYKMFRKAGHAGWKAFIPVYKDFVCFGFAWRTGVFWPYLICMILLYVLPGSDHLIVGLLTLACAVVYLALDVKLNLRVAKSFGKTKLWGVLLFFFPFVVSLILGFGKAEYIGNTTNKAEEMDIIQ